MNLREIIAERLAYPYLGCFYNKSHDHFFQFIKSVIPEDFLRRNISDLGSGDGGNTKRIQATFKPKSITCYERNGHLVQKARKRGFSCTHMDLNKDCPTGELATFTFSLHHTYDKRQTLSKVANNFDFIFLCEPVNDLYHRIFDAGSPLKRAAWEDMFKEVLGN